MYLEKEALEQKDREDFVPFTGEKKGKGHRCHILGRRYSSYLVMGESSKVPDLKVGNKPRTGFVVKKNHGW